MLLKSKKGAVETPLVIAYAVLMVVIAVFFFFIYQRIAESKTITSAGTTAYDVGTLIETAYAAPGDVEIVYENQFDTDGLPAIGSLLVNGDKNKIITHPYSEDEMYYRIANSALTAWGVGLAAKGATKINQELKQQAQRKARAEVGAWYFDSQRVQIHHDIEIATRYIHPERTTAFFNSVDGPAGPYLKNVVGDPQSIELMSKVSDDTMAMKVLSGDKRAASKLAEISRLSTSVERQIALAGPEAKTILGTDGVAYFNSKQGQVLLDNIHSDLNVQDYFKYAPTKDAGAFQDFVKTTEMFGTETVVPSILKKTATEAGSSALAKVFATSDGSDVLRVFGAERGKIRKVYDWVRHPVKSYKGHQFYDGTNQYLRDIMSSKDRVTKFSEFYLPPKKLGLPDQGKYFRDIASKSGQKGYSDVLKKVKAAGDLNDPKQMDVLVNDKSVQKVLKKSGITETVKQEEALKSIAKLNEIEPNFASALAKTDVRSWDTFYTITNPKRVQATSALLETSRNAHTAAAASKNVKLADTVADQYKAGKMYRNADGSFSLFKWAGKTKLSIRGKRMLVTIRNWGWVDNAIMVAKKAIAKVGAELMATKVGRSVKRGIAAGTTLGPLEVCAQTPKVVELGISNAICKATSIAVFTGMMALDFVTTTYPFLMMVIEGHRISEDVRSMGREFKYVGIDDSTLYVDPPDCNADIDNLDWIKSMGKSYEDRFESTKQLFKDKDGWEWFKLIYQYPLNVLSYLGPIFGELGNVFPGWTCTQQQLSTPSVEHHLNTDGECMDFGGSCPSPYIAKNELVGWKLPLINVDVNDVGVNAAWSGGMTACSIAGIADGRWGAGCYLAMYGSMAGAMTAAPDYMVPWFTGSNIYPSKDWWYSNSPVTVEISKDFDETTGKQEVSLYAGMPTEED